MHCAFACGALTAQKVLEEVMDMLLGLHLLQAHLIAVLKKRTVRMRLCLNSTASGCQTGTRTSGT